MTTEATTTRSTSDPGTSDPDPSDPISSTDWVHVDPAALLVDRNIRATRLDRPFVASVKQHGVLVPIVAVRDGEALRVRHGHRRALAVICTSG